MCDVRFRIWGRRRSGNASRTGRQECLPCNMSAKFESAVAEAMADKLRTPTQASGVHAELGISAFRAQHRVMCKGSAKTRGHEMKNTGIFYRSCPLGAGCARKRMVHHKWLIFRGLSPFFTVFHPFFTLVFRVISLIFSNLHKTHVHKRRIATKLKHEPRGCAALCRFVPLLENEPRASGSCIQSRKGENCHKRTQRDGAAKSRSNALQAGTMGQPRSNSIYARRGKPNL
jgi:hypothetical protein